MNFLITSHSQSKYYLLYFKSTKWRQSMHINLPSEVQEWIKIAEGFLQKTMPWEVEAEMNEGKVPQEIDSEHRQMAIDLGLSGMDMPKNIGGKELSNLQQVAVWEVLGRSTNALTWCFSEPQKLDA